MHQREQRFGPRVQARRVRHLIALTGVALLVGCAATPEADPGSATIWGFVQLAPKADAPITGAGYGDRRLANVKRVDYSHPRYAIVFVPDVPEVDFALVELAIRDSARGPRIEPRIASVSLNAGLRIRNETGRTQIVSAPDANHLGPIEPGAAQRIAPLVEGELAVHLLGRDQADDDAAAQIWVSPGRLVNVEPSGRYTLSGLPPGRHVVRAWHPRLPPTAPLAVELRAGEVRRIDLEIGVDAALLGSPGDS